MRNAIIYIDVDLTLVDHNGREIEGAAEMVRELGRQDSRLYLWSTAGKKYCEQVATQLGIYELFEGFAAKPDIVIDDMPGTCTNPFVYNPNDYENLTDLTRNLIDKYID